MTKCNFKRRFFIFSFTVICSADGIELGSGFIASLTMPNGLVTVLVTNHHVIHNLNEAMDATYQFSYIRSDSVDTPDPIKGADLIPANPEGFSTCMETDRVSVSRVNFLAIQNFTNYMILFLHSASISLAPLRFDFEAPENLTSKILTTCSYCKRKILMNL